MKRKLITIMVGLLAFATLHAQTTERKFTKKEIENAELIIPRPALHPIKSSIISCPGDPIDTLDTVNEQIKIILFNDNTWRYWKDPSMTLAKEDFTKHWNTDAPDAYGIPYSELEAQWSIWLVDDASEFCCPYVGNIHPRGKFGPRRGRRHQGIDLPLSTGEPIHAAFAGKVRVSKYMHGYGNVVIIRHTNGLETFYGHLSKSNVKADEWVEAGQVIGLGGSTGRSTGPHLHFETRHKGYAFDPQWIIDFQKGELRKQLFVLKKKYFQQTSNYEQDFEDEFKNEEDDIKEDEAAKKAAAAAAAIQYHTVRSGDTLGKLAQRYHTTVKKLCQLNGIKETTILQLGRKLRVK